MLASTVRGKKVFGFSDAWTKSERLAEELWDKEGRYEGGMDKPLRKIVDPVRGNHMHVRQDAALGLEGTDVHAHGDRLSLLKEETTRDGDVHAYYLNADTRQVERYTGKKVGEGRHYIDPRPKIIRSF